MGENRVSAISLALGFIAGAIATFAAQALFIKYAIVGAIAHVLDC